MLVKFTKMHGCGNDYIYFNCLDKEFEDPRRAAVFLSDRHFGIGGDGIVLICPSGKADAKMRMFNADGSEGKMCGNAIRCVGKYLYDRGIIQKETVTIETFSGIKNLELSVTDGKVQSVTVEMGRAVLTPEEIPVMLNGGDVIGRPVSIAGRTYEITCVSMGNPHCVVFWDGIDGMDIQKAGEGFEKDNIFPEGINTEFVEVIDHRALKMRVWERGSGETLACGTGACAAAVAAVLTGRCGRESDITVGLPGGELKIRYLKDGRVFMTGPAAFVFDGEIEI